VSKISAGFVNQIVNRVISDRQYVASMRRV